MSGAGEPILTLNGGSSSIKFALFAADGSLQRLLDGALSGIGSERAELWVRTPAEETTQAVKAADHHHAVQLLLDWFDKRGETLSAVGHRVVHGGTEYSAPQRIDTAMLAELRRLSPFDPEHLPEEILLTEAFHRRYPDLPQVACFDTAFHHHLPTVARLLPLPRRYAAQGVRRYGFHGLSYAYLMEELARLDGDEAANGKVILAHLGNGASLAAVRGGRCLDTSMSFTPAGGLVMSRRSGDLDPGLIAYLAHSEGLDAEGIQRLVGLESGLLGISETSADMGELLEREGRDQRAAEAVAVFCYQAKKWIGAYAAALGGLDTLVFSAGIGEHAPAVRARVCQGLEFLGIELDPAQNAAGAAVISAPASRVKVRVIHTDEERMIARAVARLLGLGNEQED